MHSDREPAVIGRYPSPRSCLPLFLRLTRSERLYLLVLFVYCTILAILSLLGGWLPTIGRWTHIKAQLLMSTVAGFMLGIALVQLLPHAYDIIGDARLVGLTMLAGLLVMFFMIRCFDFHHHHFPKSEEDDDHEHNHQPQGSHLKEAPAHDSHSHGSHPLGSLPNHVDQPGEAELTCAHDHHHHYPKKGFAWVGLMVGLSLHSVTDGIALGAAFTAEAGEHKTYLAGLATFLAVALHKPLDAMSIASVMKAERWDKTQQFLVNSIFAFLCPIGAIAFYCGVAAFLPADSSSTLGFALAFSACTFLCISLGDLLPELHFHSHDRLKLSACLCAGVAAAIALEFAIPH